jgi:hypothetical protein
VLLLRAAVKGVGSRSFALSELFLCLFVRFVFDMCLVVWWLQCPIEWFHFACVGLDSTPRGKWFCDQCKQTKKQKVKK